MSLTTTSAPAANARAVARPMPLPAPVTETNVSPKSFALAADLRAQQRPGRGLALDEVDQLGDRRGQHLRMRERRPVARLDVAAPQPRHPAGQVVVAVRAGRTGPWC